MSETARVHAPLTYAEHLQDEIGRTQSLMHLVDSEQADETDKANLAWRLHGWFKLYTEAVKFGGFLPVTIPDCIMARMTRTTLPRVVPTAATNQPRFAHARAA